MAIKEWSDAGFIFAVLLLNGVIGAIQEHSAQRAAIALRNLVKTRCRAFRDNDSYEIDAEELVVGDVILVESGDRIPADARLFDSHDLEADESLLTGESLAVRKNDGTVVDAETPLGDRRNMLFAGSLVSRGRGRAVIVATALQTEIGRISQSVISTPPAKPPLLIRMEDFTRRVSIIVGSIAIVMGAIALSQGMALNDIFLLAVALAVSAVPEGLPVALTVALAIGMRRMARENVIVRKLVAVEALGSCTFIATDKTGTLTVNQLAVRRLAIPGIAPWRVEGSATEPSGDILDSQGNALKDNEKELADRICLTAVLANDGDLSHRGEGWVHHGDAVDVALLVMARKQGFARADQGAENPEIGAIPFESERLYCASLNQAGNARIAHVKGALERLLPMCDKMATPLGDKPINTELLEDQVGKLASQGYRVIALASNEIPIADGSEFSEANLKGLTLLGLVGMIDPLRREAKDAIRDCQSAGIEVAMITGDHPTTAAAIAKELDLLSGDASICTGPQLKQAAQASNIDELTSRARVFARVEPRQKLEIVESLQRNGHFVAVSGDGANDAPALQAAQVGVAMGKSGTDVARETAELIITDDNFASIVKGVKEGRVAYANVCKVIFLLISTGMGELVLFTLSLLSGLPLPLLAVQLLWLNLVTNGIQDIALAFEPAEGDELSKPPRPPKDSIFNRSMIERVILAGCVIGTLSFIVFNFLLQMGLSIPEARNSTLLLIVLFENIHVFSCRSESRSVFRTKFFGNPILILGTLAAQLIHIGAMYTPWLSDTLHIEPVSFEVWLKLLGVAFLLLLSMEIYKLFRRKHPIKIGSGQSE